MSSSRLCCHLTFVAAFAPIGELAQAGHDRAATATKRKHSHKRSYCKQLLQGQPQAQPLGYFQALLRFHCRSSLSSGLITSVLSCFPHAMLCSVQTHHNLCHSSLSVSRTHAPAHIQLAFSSPHRLSHTLSFCNRRTYHNLESSLILVDTARRGGHGLVTALAALLPLIVSDRSVRGLSHGDTEFLWIAWCVTHWKQASLSADGAADGRGRAMDARWTRVPGPLFTSHLSSPLMLHSPLLTSIACPQLSPHVSPFSPLTLLLHSSHAPLTLP